MSRILQVSMVVALCYLVGAQASYDKSMIKINTHLVNKVQSNDPLINLQMAEIWLQKQKGKMIKDKKLIEALEDFVNLKSFETGVSCDKKSASILRKVHKRTNNKVLIISEQTNLNRVENILFYYGDLHRQTCSGGDGVQYYKKFTKLFDGEVAHDMMRAYDYFKQTRLAMYVRMEGVLGGPTRVMTLSSLIMTRSVTLKSINWLKTYDSQELNIDTKYDMLIVGPCKKMLEKGADLYEPMLLDMSTGQGINYRVGHEEMYKTAVLYESCSYLDLNAKFSEIMTPISEGS